MFSKKKLLILSAILMVMFAFKQVDEYFEISKNLEIFSTVYKTVNSEYVDDVNPGDLMKKGIDAMLASLDPYTNFYNESQAEDAMIMQSGEYGGIGCNSRRIGEYIVITNVRKGLPADKAGMRIGDKIVEVNGKNFKGKSNDEVGEALKGAPLSKVNVTVDRQGSLVQLTIERQEIKLKNVTYFGLINPNTGYIRLDHFMHGASFEVKDALIKMKAQGIKNVVLDLRDNGGGLLHEAVNIVNIFVGADQSVVVSKGRSSNAYKDYKTLDPAIDATIPLVVLVNERSASASEIVCGAIQDFDRGVIIGRNTFGKGLVQNVIPLTYRTQMKVTIAKYYIPSGRCIQLLDYSKRNPDGSPSVLADSLRKKFKTKNGRTVLDGGGVRPDITVDKKKLPNIIEGLEKSNLIFGFANQYRHQHESIGSIETFKVDDATFEAFKSYVSTQSFTHQNASEIALSTLKEKLKEDNYNTALKSETDALESALKKSKNAEIDGAKSDILKALQLEIARRYYYEEADYLISFQNDSDVLKAVELLNDMNSYKTITGSQK
ncbi:MAG: S41 family peptidase [Chitinophagaceae bacterium]